MIALLLAWAILFSLSVPLGCALMRFACVKRVQRPGDRFLLTSWLGFITLQIILMVWSLFGPITPWTALILTLLSIALLLRSRSVREEIRLYAAELSLARGCVIGVLALVVAYAETQIICNRDVVSYHFDIIHVLSRIGIAPGLGLIEHRYGFFTSWYGIPALFNHGPLTAHMAPVANGFAFCLLLGQLMLTGWRILRGEGQAIDWFVVVAPGFASVFPIFLNDPVSTTGDFAILLVTLVVTWSALIIYSPSGNGASEYGKQSLRDEHIVPLYLAACLWTIKISTAPVLGSIGVLYLIHHRFRIKAWIVSGCTAGLIILPQVIAVTLMTGYPLYPLRNIHIHTAWTLGPHHYLTKSRWGVIPGYDDSNYLSWNWLVKWLQLDATCVIAFIFFLASIAALIGIMARHRHRWKEVLPSLLIGLTGLALFLIKSPFARFSWAYLCILPATLFFLSTSTLNQWVALLPTIVRRARGAVLLPLVGLVGMVLVVSVGGKTKSEMRVHQALEEGRIQIEQPPKLWMPPQIPLLVFDDAEGLVHPYAPPQEALSEQLASPRPMFYPLIPREGIVYRDAGRGPRAGFMHAP